jgi:DNA-3-methyladenine glycosylase I
MASAPRSGVVTGDDGRARCFWGASDPLYLPYHDREWGFPVKDDVRLFEKLCLEGFQAGLAWITILRKRPAFRKAFKGFEPEAVARMNTLSVERLLRDPGIVRHRGKIESTLQNARRYLELREEFGSLAAYVWRFEPAAKERPRKLTWTALRRMSQTPTSQALSKDLRQRGWAFVGPTTAYAFMQAMGLVNDHIEGCHAREPALAKRRTFRLPKASPERGSEGDPEGHVPLVREV